LASRFLRLGLFDVEGSGLLQERLVFGLVLRRPGDGLRIGDQRGDLLPLRQLHGAIEVLLLLLRGGAFGPRGIEGDGELVQGALVVALVELQRAIEQGRDDGQVAHQLHVALVGSDRRCS